MLKFAAICPHPPIIVPEVGGEELKRVQKTVRAMQKLNKIFVQEKPAVVFLISPHTIFTGREFNLLTDIDLSGSLEMFGAPEVQLSFGSEPEFAKRIQEEALKQGLSVHLPGFFELDHASIVPLYYLSQNYDSFHLVISSFSTGSIEDHFQYGKIVGEIAQKYSKRVAIIASGDLSHCLSPTAPGGYSARGEEFDQSLVNLIQENDVQGIINLDPSLIEEAGECGLRSIIILLGVLSSYHYSPLILSYEGPFGVGYLVANFKLGLKHTG